MLKSKTLSHRTVTKLLLGGVVFTDVFIILAQHTLFWPLKLLLLILLIVVPGISWLRCFRITLPPLFAVFYCFGLGVLTLILSGLFANQFFPLLRASRPLELEGVFISWNILTTCFLALSNHIDRRSVKIQLQTQPWRLESAVSFVLGGSFYIALVIAGAFRLNNGGNALIAGLALAFASVALCYLFIFRNRISDKKIIWSLFCLALGVLLMTSMRGWDIVGHDIQREFRVFTLADMNAHWNIALNRDPYNACLSITILPEVLARLLNISGLVVFKVLLQSFFALCVPIIYLLLRQYASKIGALSGAVIFISYPTFINDSAMLTRQGVAYMFFALCIALLFQKTSQKRYKLLFICCAIGAILSHYSTSYMFVALFIVAGLVKLLTIYSFKKWRPQKLHRIWEHRSVLSLSTTVLLFAMTFMWYSQITATSGGLAITLKESFVKIPRLFSDDNKSSDTASALLFSTPRTQQSLLKSYLSSSSQRDHIGSMVTSDIVSDDMPLTAFGKKLHNAGFNPGVIPLLRQNYSKFLQILALVSVAACALHWYKSRAADLHLDFVCLCLAGLVLLALLVLLPVLSVNYGILRAFQQGLIFLLVPIVWFLSSLGRSFSRAAVPLATFMALFLFLLFTSALGQLVGGVSPALTLNNSGLYYGLYYTSQVDTQGYSWLKQNFKPRTDIRAANFNKALMHDPEYPFTRSGILPLQIAPKTIVYADPTQVKLHRLYVYYQSSPLMLTYPLDYFDYTRNEIYSTASTRVYQ